MRVCRSFEVERLRDDDTQIATVDACGERVEVGHGRAYEHVRATTCCPRIGIEDQIDPSVWGAQEHEMGRRESR